jgi:hypothetical protein
MSGTAKVSISVPDAELLRWAKQRSERTGVSLSAVFMEAVRIERQMEARRRFLAEMGAAGVPTPEEAAAIRAEWETADAASMASKRSAPAERAKRPSRARRATSKRATAAARGAKR